MSDPIRVLLIGDPHVTVEELPDCQRLLDYVDRVVGECKPNLICFLGDQHHTHAVVRVEVLEFWARWLRTRQNRNAVWMLVGNHDRSHDTNIVGNTLRYAASPRNDGAVIVVDGPSDFGPLRFMPWYAKPEDFIKAAGDAKTLICHQTMQGATYENGYPAADGVPAESVPAKTIISGHIHTRQAFGKVWYPGAPRWRTASDANLDRAIWAVDFDLDGNIVDRKAYSTLGVCQALFTHDDIEGAPEHNVQPRVAWTQPCKLIINIHGSPNYVEERTKTWKKEQPGCRVNPFPTRVSKNVVRESDGVPVALKNYVSAYQPKFGTPADQLQRMVADRVQL